MNSLLTLTLTQLVAIFWGTQALIFNPIFGLEKQRRAAKLRSDRPEFKYSSLPVGKGLEGVMRC